jgi:glucan 1,4-alpha-glucosidase
MGAITGDSSKYLSGTLTFLPAGKKYVATIYGDAFESHWQTNPMAYEVKKFIVERNTKLRLTLAPGGGTAVSIIPATANDLKKFLAYQ